MPYRKILKLFTSYSSGNLLTIAISTVMIPFYTLKLTPADYGVIALLMVITRIMTRVVDSPVSHSFKRYYFKPEYIEIKGELTFCLLTFLVGKLLIILFFYLALSYPIAKYFLKDETLLNLVLLNGFLMMLTPVRSFLANINILQGQAKTWLFINILASAITASVTLYGLFILNLGVYAMMYGLILAALVPTVINLYLTRQYIKPSRRFSILKEPLRFGYPLIFNGFANTTIQSGDKIILQAMMNISSVGLYSFGYTVSGIINSFIVMPIKNAVTPAIYQKEDNEQEQKKLIADIGLAYYIISLFLVFLLGMFIQEILQILIKNKDYWPAASVVPVLAYSYVIQGLGNFFEIGLMMKQKSKTISAILVICTVSNVLLNILFIPFMGMMGAAYATLVAFFIWTGLRYYSCNKHFPITINFRLIVSYSFIVITYFYAALFISAKITDGINAKHLLSGLASFVLIIAIKTAFALCLAFIIWFLVLPDSMKLITIETLKKILLRKRVKK